MQVVVAIGGDTMTNRNPSARSFATRFAEAHSIGKVLSDRAHFSSLSCPSSARGAPITHILRRLDALSIVKVADIIPASSYR